MKYMVICICVVMVSCSKHHPAPVYDVNGHYKKTPQAKKKKKKKNTEYVTVIKGDTLYSIGFNFNIDYKTLARINNIPSPYRIYPGQKLKLKEDRSTNRLSTVKTSPIVADKPLTPKPQIKSTSKPSSIKTQKPIVQNVVKKPVKNSNSQSVKKPVKNHMAPQSNQKWIWPIKGQIISSFSHTDNSRKGINIATPMGKPVNASNNGIVVYSGDGLRGYGELIILKHADNLLSAYAHNSRRLVKEGDNVKQGQKIALSGKDEDGRGLLHFEIRKNGQPVNPVKYLPK